MADPFRYIQSALLGRKRKLEEILGEASKLYTDNYIRLTDTKATTVNGGSAASGLTTKQINTEDSDNGNHCELAYALDYDAQTSNFTVGQTVTDGTSGATGTIVADEDSGATGTLYITSVSGTFGDNNTITDPLGGSATANIPSGLLGKGFYLQPGYYIVEVKSTAYRVDLCRIILTNINDSVDYIGKNGYSQTTSVSSVDLFLEADFTINQAKTFKLDQYSQTAKATNGLGLAVSDGNSEIYTTIRMRKIQ